MNQDSQTSTQPDASTLAPPPEQVTLRPLQITVTATIDEGKTRSVYMRDDTDVRGQLVRGGLHDARCADQGVVVVLLGVDDANDEVYLDHHPADALERVTPARQALELATAGWERAIRG